MTIQVQEQSRHVVLVTIDHQPRRNAMTRPMLAELARLWDSFERASYRCIILTGAGEQAFCAGADMSGDLSVDVETATVVNHALLKHHPFSKPIIAAVNGDCVGGGLDLLLATDIRATSPRPVLGCRRCAGRSTPLAGRRSNSSSRSATCMPWSFS